MKILVIEDEKKMALFIKRGLEEERYIVETAFDGQTGLEMALHNQYDAIVLDVMLPKRNGLAVLSAMRAAGNVTPVLMLTARGNTEDRVAGLDLGADDYMPKPFHFEELAALLEYLMRNKNRIISRSMITQHVWKHNFDPESNIIDVYIKRIRSKIERPGSARILQSIRGVGYRMRETEPTETETEDDDVSFD